VDSKNLVLEQILCDSEAKEREIASQYHDQFCHLQKQLDRKNYLLEAKERCYNELYELSRAMAIGCP